MPVINSTLACRAVAVALGGVLLGVFGVSGADPASAPRASLVLKSGQTLDTSGEAVRAYVMVGDVAVEMRVHEVVEASRSLMAGAEAKQLGETVGGFRQVASVAKNPGDTVLLRWAVVAIQTDLARAARSARDQHLIDRIIRDPERDARALIEAVQRRDALLLTDAERAPSLLHAVSQGARLLESVGAHERAAAMYRELLAHIEHFDRTIQWRRDAWRRDFTLRSIATNLADAGDIDGAVDALLEIKRLPTRELRIPAGSHVVIAMGDRAMNDFRPGLALAWLERTPWDEFTPEIVLRLMLYRPAPGARTTINVTRDAALQYYDRLLADHPELLREADALGRTDLQTKPDDPAWMQEPVTSNLAVAAWIAFRDTKQTDRALELAEMIASDFPRHPSAAAVAHWLFHQRHGVR